MSDIKFASLVIKKETNQFCLDNYKVSAKWKKAPNFVVNKRAKLVHRPIEVTQLSNNYNFGNNYHLCVSTLCGSSFTGDFDKLQFTNNPESSSVVCFRCEVAAIDQNLPASIDIVDADHVHIGTMKIKKICCK